MRAIAGKLIRLRPADWRDLVRAQKALIEAQLVVWLRPRGELVSPSELAQSSSDGEIPSVGAVDPGVARLALALDRVARMGPIRPQCLVRAMALARLLASCGYSGASVKVGVRRTGKRFVAHAWVEYGGVVVGEDEAHVQDFVTMSDVEVLL